MKLDTCTVEQGTELKNIFKIRQESQYYYIPDTFLRIQHRGMVYDWDCETTIYEELSNPNSEIRKDFISMFTTGELIEFLPYEVCLIEGTTRWLNIRLRNFKDNKEWVVEYTNILENDVFRSVNKSLAIALAETLLKLLNGFAISSDYVNKQIENNLKQ